jgi:hypothetical protein
MQAELKQKWIEALRSGKYEQGRGQLRDASNRYCCLGVLADVCGVEWAQNTQRKYYPKGEVHIFYINSEPDNPDSYSDRTLSPKFQDQVGLDGGQHHCLLAMNDNLRRTFNDIADYIESKSI